MRVLFNTKPFLLSDKTGVGYHILNLYKALKTAGIDVVPTINSRSGTVISSLSEVSSHFRKVIGKRYPSFIRKIGDSLMSYLSREGDNTADFDIYHETSLDPLPEIHITSVCNLYDLSFISCPDLVSDDLKNLMKANMAPNLMRAGRVMVNTEFIKNEAMHFLKIPEEKIDVIPLAPTFLSYMSGESLSDSECVRKFTETNYVLYVGTVEPRKNLKTLIRAFSDVRKTYDLSLIIAGRLGWLYDDVLSLPQESGLKEDVIFTQYVDEQTLRCLYSHASVFVYPSLYEGFGLPPLEAMVCRVPVIVSDIPSLTEVSGDAAMTFNPRDHEELADKMNRVLSSETLKSELVEKGLKKASEYSWEKAAAMTIRSYEKALAR